MNKAILTDSNGSEIRFSKVQNFDGNVTFRDLSIKYVVKGSETYQTADSKYLIGQNEYMIGAKNI